MVGSLQGWAKTAFGRKRPEPSYPQLPVSNDRGESNIPGITLIGEVAGTPLVKLGLNDGVEAIDRLHAELGPSTSTDQLDVVIIGAGSSGLGAAMRAHELGMRYQVLEANRIANTIVNMYKGKLLFAEPETLANKSTMWFEECTREQLLERWHAQIDDAGLKINEFEKVEDIKGRAGDFTVVTAKGAYSARRVLMGVGKAGNPRKAGVAGESAHPAKVFHHLADPAEYSGQNIFVYGGGDVAAEAVIALAESNTVTMVTIDEELVYPKKRNKDALYALQKAGKLDLNLASKLIDFDETTVTFENASGETMTIENDVVFEMIGAVLPLKFFEKVGIKLEGTWTPGRWTYLAIVSILVYTLYALKKFPESPYSWPFNKLMSVETFNAGCLWVFEICFFPFRWLFTAEAYADIQATVWFQQGFIYSFLYTVAMGVFGYKALIRWVGVAKDGRYQKWRFVSLILFQVGFFLIVNIVAVQALSIQHSWRAWGLYAPWPLFFNTFHWWSESDPKAVIYLFAGVGAAGFLVAIPLAARWHGKRFCTWICGCGGLAETLGDRWRHLSPKGKRSRSWEFQGAVILVAAAIVTIITVGMFDTRADNGWAKGYSYIVDFWLVAVIPVALYPFFGGKVWCRYWCPLAAWNQVLSKIYGKLKIKSNDKCITCTLCSKYCQVGVDVMAFAKNQEPFDNANSVCIQCGICIDVCPMGVLEFTTGEVQLSKAALEESF